MEDRDDIDTDDDEDGMLDEDVKFALAIPFQSQFYKSMGSR